ncbi:MAG: hypothetical protein QOK04_127, partial [Solirubrobacteraceae bacterium]|nr:hypothetical protein [Solirubrobacteraceae bacterium]
SNVLIAPNPDGDHVYLTDFGIARQTDASGAGGPITKTGMFVGTVDYKAPERIEGKRGDARSDIYAFGCMLFQTLTGQVPFPRASEVAKIYAHLSEPFPSLTAIRSDAPPALETVIARATARSPDERYDTAAEMGQALSAAAASGPGVATHPAAAPEPTAPMEPPTTPATVPASGPEPAAPTAPARTEPAAPAPQPATAPTAGSPRRRRRTVVALAAGAVAVAVGAVALIASGALSGGGGGGGTVIREKTQSTTGAAQASAVPTLVPFSSSELTASVPSKWNHETKPGASLTRDQWTDPADPSTSVLVDAVGPSPVDQRASRNRNRGASQPGYEELSFQPATLGNRDAYAWEYRLPDKQRIDYFVNGCDTGYAIQGTAPPQRFAALRQMFQRVAESVQPPGCS